MKKHVLLIRVIYIGTHVGLSIPRGKKSIPMIL